MLEKVLGGVLSRLREAGLDHMYRPSAVMKSVRSLELAYGQDGHNASPIRQHARGGRTWGC